MLHYRINPVGRIPEWADSMTFTILIGATLYGVIGLTFLILSATELLESGRSTTLRLVSTLLTSLIWPLTIVVMSFVVAISRSGPMLERSLPQPTY